MALQHDADGFLVGDVIPEIKRMNKVSDKIRRDVAMIKRYLKTAAERKVNPPPTPDRTRSQNQTERTQTERTRRTVEPRQRDSRGRFTRNANNQNGNNEQSQIDRIQRTQAEVNETQARTEQERQQTERQRDANGRFTSDRTRQATVEPNGRKRNTKGQFESSADKSFLSRSLDGLGDKITGAIQLGTAGLEEVDPTVKAFQEVAEPLSRGYQFMFGNKDDKRDKKYFGWLGKIWKSVRKTENNTEESSRESGGGLLGSLMTGLMGSGLFAAIGSVLALIFSPVALGIGAAGIAAWGLFTKSGNKFFAGMTEGLVSSWQKSVDWTVDNVFQPIGDTFNSIETAAVKKWDDTVATASAMFESMGKKWDEVVAGGKALLDKFVIDPVKKAKNYVTENHAGAVAWTSDKMERTANAAGAVKDSIVGGYDNAVNWVSEGLGSLSSKYEGKVGSANKDNIGHAYGKYQFNSKTGGLSRLFKDNPEYAKQFEGIAPDSKAFYAKWREIAKKDPKGFEAAQDKSAANLWYKPAKEHADKLGFNTANKGVQEAIFSGSIQHGGIKKVLSRVAKNNDLKNMSPEEQVKAFYAERRKYVGENLSGRDLSNQYKRYASEEKDALRLSTAKPTATPFSAQQITRATAKPTLPTQAVMPAMPFVAAMPKPTPIPEMPVLTLPIASDRRSSQQPIIIQDHIGQDLPDRKLALIATGGLSAP